MQVYAPRVRTLTVVYGATGIGKTHLGLTFADHGRTADGARGIVLDMNGRGDSQQHHAYAERLFGWPLDVRARKSSSTAARSSWRRWSLKR